jgi:Probable Zinc-ribbon domain
VAVRHVRLTAGGFWSEAKSGGRGKPTSPSKRRGGAKGKSAQKGQANGRPQAASSAKKGDVSTRKSEKLKIGAPAGKLAAGNRAGGVPRSGRRDRALPQVSQVATSWWSPANARRPRQVDAGEHTLAWWRCPRGKHPDWREYIDVVVRGSGQCPSCPPRVTRSRPSRRRTVTRKKPEPSRRELSPRERALGTNALLLQLNPPEAIRDSWR